MAGRYSIGGLVFEVMGEPLQHAMAKMGQFAPFEYHGSGTPLFSMEWSNDYGSLNVESATRLYVSECDGASSAICSLGGEFLVKSWYLESPENLLLWTAREKLHISGDLSPQILRFTLWLGYGLMAIRHNRIPLHSSAVVFDGAASLFLGESGTGKSTHTSLWVEHIHGAELLNDDSPIVAVENGEVWAYGSPWSGKKPCFRQEKFRLKGLVRLAQAPYNRMEKLACLKAYAALHPSCPPEFSYHEGLYDYISGTLSQILATIPVYYMECLPDREAALLSHKTIYGL